jgi:hypothetical protein
LFQYLRYKCLHGLLAEPLNILQEFNLDFA